ncbi:MAG: hypothetical protein ACE5KT_07275, partial [Methanosarcinales archaeon]
MWGQYISGETYYVYIDFNNDSVADERIPWMAYTVGDSYWNSVDADKDAAHAEASCNKYCHSMADNVSSIGEAGRTGKKSDGEPVCSDCHGISSEIGTFPYNGTNNTLLYQYGFGHPRKGEYPSVKCGDSSCHNQFTGDKADVDDEGTVPVPGYPAGTYNITNAYYPNPSQCGECHDYKDAVMPSIYGHNKVIECKYCHGGYHAQANLTTFTNYTRYNDSIPYDEKNDTGPNGTPGYNATYAGECYNDCHKFQEKHAGTVACEECHTSYNIAPFHQETLEPMKPKDTCGGCHHNNSYTYNGIKPPQQPILKHSLEVDGVWGEIMGYNRPFWSEEESSCRYCHGRTYNDKEAIGRIKYFQGNNIVNSSITNTSYWCASCHYKGYKSGNATYQDMVDTYNYSMGMVPPEITNGTYAPSNNPNFFNHTNILEIGTPNEDISDLRCKECHGTLLSEGATMNEFMHNTEKGGGGPDCLSCHNMSAPEIPKINATSMEKSVHANLNYEAENTTNLTSPVVKACWACHGDGSQPEKHPPGYMTPKKCEECHILSNEVTPFNATPVFEHLPESSDVQVRQGWYCTNCHNNSIDKDHNDTGINAASGKNETWLNATVAHYGNNDTLKELEIPSGENHTTDCMYCHYNNTNAIIWGNATNIENITKRLHPERTVEKCYACHSETSIAPTTLHAPEVYSPKDIPPYRAKVYVIKTRSYDQRESAKKGNISYYYSGPSATFMVDPASWLDAYYFDLLDGSNVDYWWYPKATIRVLLLDSDGNKVSDHVLKFTITDPSGNIIRNGAYNWNNSAGKPVDGTAGDPDVNEDGILL